MDAARVEALTRAVGMLADRLRTMSDTRLNRAFPPAASRAEAALAMAQRLADAAQGVEDRAAAGTPTFRPVPDLGVFALGDQIAVTGRDLVLALAHVGDDDHVWTRAGGRTAAVVVTELTDAVNALRRAI